MSSVTSPSMRRPPRGPTLLNVMGPSEVLTSSELQERLVSRGYGKAGAKQAISRAARAGDGLWRSNILQLPRGERLFARSSFAGTREFYQAAQERLRSTRPGLARCLEGLAENQVLHKVHAQRLVGAAVQARDIASSPTFDASIRALSELGVRVASRGAAHEYLLGGDQEPSSETDRQALQELVTLRKESVLARLLVNRLRKQNLVSWSGSELPSRELGHVVFNGQVFTAVGFSFLAPLVRVNSTTRKATPCPVFIDTFAGLCRLGEVQAFVARADNARCWGKLRQPYLGVIAAREFDDIAWKEAKSRGLITVNLKQMFGEEALNAMAIVERILGDLKAGRGQDNAIKEMREFTDALESLKSNPVVADLCAIGFELLTGLVLRAEGYEGVTLGQDVPFQGQRTRDVDVFGNRGDDVIVVECKAHHERKELTREEVKKFFTETVPAFRAWWTKKQGRQPRKCTAQMWTSGQVGRDAEEMLQGLALKANLDPALVGPSKIIERLPSSLKTRAVGILDALAKGGQD